MNFINFYAEIENKLEEMDDGTIFSFFQSHVFSDAPIYYQIIKESFKSYQTNFTPALYQSHVSNQIRKYCTIKDTFEQFNDKIFEILNQGQKQFKQVFPDFKLESPILIGHSMDCFDGAIRYIDNTRYLAFGTDVISRLYRNISPKPFIIHELFHEYHRPLYQKYKDEGSILDALWMEGLAVYVSELIVPGSSIDELTLNNPKGMIQLVEQNIKELIAELEKNLDSTQGEIYQKFFLGPLDKNRYRAGYYIGYLFVKFMRTKISLTDLIHISGVELIPLIKEFFKNVENSIHE